MLDHLTRFRDVLSRVHFNDWRFIVHSEDSSPYLQIEVGGKCNVTSEPLQWKGRKWKLSVWMTDGEIVGTAFKAVMTALEHETREQFLYRGAAVYDSHYDIERLVALRNDPSSISERPVTSLMTACSDCKSPHACQSHATCYKHTTMSQVG